MPTCRTDSPCAWLVGAYVVATLVTPVQAQDDGTGTVHLDSGNTGKTVFAIVTLLSMFYLGTVLGSRCRKFTRKSLPKMTFIRTLVLVLYCLNVGFIFSSAILMSGLNLSTKDSCRGAVYVCLVFYFLAKGVIQVFLTERAHAVRAHRFPRVRDWVWILYMVLIISGFGTIMVLAFIWPIAEISGSDGKCRIGLPLKITVPMIAYDIFINATLTGVFVWLLRPLMRRRMSRPQVQAKAAAQRRFSVPLLQKLPKAYTGKSASETSLPLEPSPTLRYSFISRQWDWIHVIVYKSMLGAVLVLLPTIANLALLSHMHGSEQGWECLTFCSLDVTWSVCVLHWLTVGPNEEAPVEKMHNRGSIGLV